MDKPESVILERHDNDDESSETNKQKNEILYKVIELEHRLQKFDDLFV